VRVHVEYVGRVHLDEGQATELWWTKKVFIALMLLTIVATPIPMGSDVQSTYIKGWVGAIAGYILTPGIAEFGTRPTPVAVLQMMGKAVHGLRGHTGHFLLMGFA
jgi:hypothetical protein